MSAWIFWIIFAGVLIALEVLTQWIWTFCLAIGCVGALVAYLLDASLPMQIVVAAVVGIIAYFVSVPVMKKRFIRQQQKGGESSRTGMEALLGRRAEVLHEIEPGKLGRARIDGDRWQVRAPGVDSLIRRGSTVVVTGYDSIILTVKPLDPIS